MKNSKQPFRFSCSRRLPTGELLFDTDELVSLEDYTIKEDASEGFDLIISIKLLQFRPYQVKTMQIGTQGNKKIAKVTKTPTEKPIKPKTHKVVGGIVCGISQKNI